MTAEELRERELGYKRWEVIAQVLSVAVTLLLGISGLIAGSKWFGEKSVVVRVVWTSTASTNSPQKLIAAKCPGSALVDDVPGWTIGCAVSTECKVQAFVRNTAENQKYAQDDMFSGFSHADNSGVGVYCTIAPLDQY